MSLARLVSAAPDVALGAAFLLTWIRPEAVGFNMLRYGMLSMLLEFIVIHSAAFMGVAAVHPTASLRLKGGAMLGLGLMYTLFVGAFALIFGEWWPLVAFWSLTLNRLAGVLLHTAPRGEEQEALARGWAMSAALYIVWVLPTAFLPVPRLGLTDSIVMTAELPGSGLWVDEPQRLIAAGAAYYPCQAAYELWGGVAAATVKT